MKILPRLAPRTLLLVTISILTLAALLWAIAGWWAADAKSAALRAMEERGRITSVTDIQRPLPPDHLNFGMLPIFVDLRGESAAKPAEDGWSAKLDDFGQDRHAQSIRRPQRGEPFDWERIRQRHEIEGSAADLLREFDLRHEAVLAQFRAGLDLPHASRPRTMDLSDPAIFFNAWAADTMRLQKISAGLAFRAELAIAAGEADIALESLLIAGRILDLTTSDETLIFSLMVSHSIAASRASAMSRGLEQGIWNEAQIDRLLASWSSRGDRAALSRAINIEGLLGAIYIGHLKRDRSLWMDQAGAGERLFWNLVPGSWFDAKAAGMLQSTEAWLQRLEPAGPLLTLWDDATLAIERADGASPWDGIGSAAPSLVRKHAQHSVLTAQAQLALQLARHRLTHGVYPPSLDDLDGDPVTDPLTGDPFIYRSDGTTIALYSPGPDQIDNGGSRPGKSNEWDHSGTDWVW
jgi:hypothetical protein